MITTIISTIVVLGILIFVHELGHFLVAKWNGVTVLRFSFGFGPRLIGFKRGETDYCLSAIPLGGYVKMLGEEVGDEVDEEQLGRSFQSQHVFRRILIVLAGPVSNFILAVIIFAGIFAVKGYPVNPPVVGTVNADSPAEQAGIRAGDLIVSIGDDSIESWDDLILAVLKAGEKPITVRILRDGQEKSFSVTPRLMSREGAGEKVKYPVIGVVSAPGSLVDVGPIGAIGKGFYETWRLSKTFISTVKDLVTGALSVKTLGGPIAIGKMAGQHAQEGLLALVSFIAFISVNLAVLNLLPIPILDGGHIVFFLFEAVLGRPLGEKKIEWAQKIGMVLLLMLMIIVFYNDIMRLIPGAKPDFLP